jgi:Leucine-rich repeat (LRR) protein
MRKAVDRRVQTMNKQRLMGKILGTALVFLTLCLLSGGLALRATNSVAAADGAVTFPDPNLEAAIREAIGKPTGDILESDLGTVTYFDAMYRDISNIVGLQYCVNLEQLWLGDNRINDISPISSLSNLDNLGLSNNEISNLSPLSSLTNLKNLFLASNQLSNLSPISGLTNLTMLNLWANQISNISPLSSLTNLDTLYLAGNQVSDVSALSGLTNLGTLRLDNNQIINIIPLSGLNNLEELHLDYNQISDIGPLYGLTDLDSLYLYNNQISDVSPLSGLINLERLWLFSNQISDITPLSGLMELGVLLLDYNQIADIGPLSSLTKLGEDTWFPEREGIPICLGLLNNQVADISPLVANAGLADGDGIDLRGNPLSDQSCNIYIPQLEGRGVNILYDAPPPPGIAWNFPSTSAVFLGPTPANGRPYLDAAVLLPTGTEPAELSGVYWLDEATGGWQYFIPGYGGSTLTSLEPGQSYLIAVCCPCSWNLPCGEGSPWPTGDTWDFPSTSAVFLGPTPASGRPYLNAAVPLPTGTEPAELSGVYWLDEPTGGWQYFIPGYGGSTLTSLEPDEAYLVAVSGPCSWNLT